jgi:hypothetical protein
MMIDWEKLLGIGVPLFISALVVFLNWRDHFHKETVDAQGDLLVQYKRVVAERDEANKRADLAELAVQAIRDVMTPAAIQDILEAYEKRHSK